MARDAIARIGARTPRRLLPVTWMGLIMLLSTDMANAQRTGRFLIPLLQWACPGAAPRKWRLFTGPGQRRTSGIPVLGALWFRPWPVTGRPCAATWLVLAIAVGWATLDEIHQFFVPSRGASVVDVALDTAGAAVAVMLLQGLAHRGRGHDLFCGWPSPAARWFWPSTSTPTCHREFCGSAPRPP